MLLNTRKIDFTIIAKIAARIFQRLSAQSNQHQKTAGHNMISKRQLEFTEDNEGYLEFMYQCSAGKTTIGIGLNLEAGIPHDEALILLTMRLEKIHANLSLAYSWFAGLNEQQKVAIVDMAYQLGLAGLAKFKLSLALMAQYRFEDAALEFLDSNWAQQTPQRAKRVTDLIRG